MKFVGSNPFKIICILLIFLVERGYSEKVLVLVPIQSKSHKNVFEPIVDGLVKKGHSVTIVSAWNPSKERENVREIVPSNFSKVQEQFFGNPFEKRTQGLLKKLGSGNFNFVFEGCRDVFRNAEFMGLLNEKFDLVFIDAVMHECFDGFVYKLGAPFIMVATFAVPGSTAGFVGNRLPPSFVPFFMLDFDDQMTFLERIINLSAGLAMEIAQHFLFHPKFEAVYRQFLGQDIPGIQEINSNVSMIFSNSHISLTPPRPLLPDIVEVGGMHCKDAKPLPKELENFVSGSKDGFIFFSLGSIVEGKLMPEETRKVFLNVFSRLKQRVLWKWEADSMEGLPKNVMVSKWVPQQSILAHPSIKIFCTHGGLLSTQEAAFYGVPIIGIPIFGDQDLNAKQAERAGYGLKVEIIGLTEEILESAIHKILNEKRFSDRAKELSRLARDQSESPLQRAIFWTEYVMRHKGARHLRSAARQLNFIQYHSLDVLALLVLILTINLWIAKLILWKIWRKVFKKTNSTHTKKTQ